MLNEAPVLSVTVTVTGDGPGEAKVDTVPEIVPAELSVRPFGRNPPVIANVYGPVPPLASKVVEYAAPWVAFGSTPDDVIVTRTTANTWVVQTQPAPNDKAFCLGDGQLYHVPVHLTVVTDQPLP